MGQLKRTLKPLGRNRAQRVLLRIVLYGGAIFVGLPLAFSFVMTSTHRGNTSEYLPRDYQRVELVSQGLKLRAWIFEGKPDKAAFVIVHGLGDNLESYLVHAEHLINHGHTVILPDLRGHGASEGRHTTMGGKESEDVRTAIRYLRKEGLAAEGIALMGHSMGAVAVLLAAADQTDVRAVIVEAPFDTYRNTVAHHAKLLYGLPSWVPIIPLSIRFAEWRAEFDADEVDAVAAARRVGAPLLAIVDGLDERMPESVVGRIFDAHPGPKRLWVADGVNHVEAILHADWEGVVLGFLDEHDL